MAKIVTDPEEASVWYPRIFYLFALLAVIAAGLTLRGLGYQMHLPFAVVKYGGSALWGAMVYLILVLIA